MPETSQDPGAVLTYKDDWTKHLADNGDLTIVSAVVTATGGAVVSNVTPQATSVLFRLAVDAVANPPVTITTTTSATLSNGDVDVRHHTIQITNT